MRDIEAAYRWVQAQKALPYDPGPDTVAAVVEGLKKQLGTDDIRLVQHTLMGMGWIFRMMEQERLPVTATFAIPDRISRNMIGNLGDQLAVLSPPQLVEAGVGGSFFTGLWVGRRLDGQ